MEPTRDKIDDRMSRLRASISSVQARFRLREAVALAPVAVALALVAALLLAMMAWFADGLAAWVVVVAGVLFVVAALATVFLYAFLRPCDLMRTARSADRLLSLDERLATALEAATKAPEEISPLRDVQLDDTLAS